METPAHEPPEGTALEQSLCPASTSPRLLYSLSAERKSHQEFWEELGGVGRGKEELGGVGRGKEELGGVGRGKEELGGIGRSWRSQEGERRTVVTSTSLSPTQDTAVLLETANYRAVLLYS